MARFRSQEPSDEDKEYAKRLDNTDFEYEICEAARFWGMTPFRFRDLPNEEQIEMMAHRREVNLRKAHTEKVGKTVAEVMEKRRKDEERDRKRRGVNIHRPLR